MEYKILIANYSPVFIGVRIEYEHKVYSFTTTHGRYQGSGKIEFDKVLLELLKLSGL